MVSVNTLTVLRMSSGFDPRAYMYDISKHVIMGLDEHTRVVCLDFDSNVFNNCSGSSFDYGKTSSKVNPPHDIT